MEEDRGQILLYQTPDGESRIEVRLQGETVWLSLEQMAELFQRNKSTICRHIKNVFEEGELDKEVVVAKYATTTQHGAIEGKSSVLTHELENDYQKTFVETNKKRTRPQLIWMTD